METISKKSSKLDYSLFFIYGILLVIAGLISWYMYGFKKHIPEPVSAVVSQEYDLNTGGLNDIKLHVGDSVTLMGYDGYNFWTETKNGTRGIFFKGAIDNWQAISETENMEKYQLVLKNYCNIGIEDFKNEYLGHSFQENETNHWPALYCSTQGNILYATYHIRMWDGTNCWIPTVRYEDGIAKEVLHFSEAPFDVKREWLRITPWAGWMYKTPFLHFHWDRPMITKNRLAIDSWPWIFRAPIKLLLIGLVLIVALMWISILCSLFVIAIMWLVELRYPLMFLSNLHLGVLLSVAALAGCWFWLPFIVLNHGAFITVIILFVAFGFACYISLPLIELRCDVCRCYGSIDVYKKVYTHTETKESEEKILNSKLSNAECNVYDVYAVTTETPYYDHYCRCEVCGNESIQKDKAGKAKETKKHTGLSYSKRTPSNHTRSRGGSGGGGENSSNRDSDAMTPYSPHKGYTCSQCTYFSAGHCSYFDTNSVNYGTSACANFSV